MNGAPRLVVEIQLEQPPVFTILAATLADELRLRLWLGRSGALRHVPAIVDAALDELDRRAA